MPNQGAGRDAGRDGYRRYQNAGRDGRDRSYRPPPYQKRRRAFEACVKIELDFDCAYALGEFILDNHCQHNALLQLARQLVGEDQCDEPERDRNQERGPDRNRLPNRQH